MTSSHSNAIAEKAAQWIVLLSSDDKDDRDNARQAFEAWKQEDFRHAEVASRIEKMINSVQGLRGEDDTEIKPAKAALTAVFTEKRKASRNKIAGSMLGIFLILILPLLFVLRVYSPDYLLADIKAGTGNWVTETLDDGTLITLNSASAVNVHYSNKQRILELVKGDILVNVAHDSSRPFIVVTDHGSITALGTKFVVRKNTDSTDLDMLESKVLVQSAEQRISKPNEGIVVHAGQHVRVSPNGFGKLTEIDARSVEDTWNYHQLVVQGQPLVDVLDEIDRFRPGRISFDRTQLQGKNVSAVLPLENTDSALKLLNNSFPELRIRTFTSYLVIVDTQKPD